MTFTALHRELGLTPGPLTDQMITQAVETGIQESGDLDWKRQLPPTSNLLASDFPKDIAAMANSGGGIIVYGVEESEKAATSRRDVGELTEGHERSLRQVAVSAISPPVFGLEIHRLGDQANRAVVIVVPASTEGPHLIYNKEYFGAPVRNDSDTVWLKERQIEAMYRARFEERRHATEALDNLYAEASAGRPTHERAWVIMVACPRIPRVGSRPTEIQARELLRKAARDARGHAPGGIHPLENVDVDNPRPGLRRWVAVNTATGERSRWKEAWATIHHDGSVTLAAAVGGFPARGPGDFAGSEVDSGAIECAVADFLLLAHLNMASTPSRQYEVRAGVEWVGEGPLTILTADASGYTYDGRSVPLHRYTPVETTVDVAASDLHRQIHDLARDCVNQGGISNLRSIWAPDED